MSKENSVYVKLDDESQKEFEALIETFTNTITTPTKKDIIQLCIKEVYEKYVEQPKKIAENVKGKE